MHRFFLTAFAAGLLLADPAAAWTRITTEAEFQQQIVGRTQVIEGQGHITSTADGNVSGEWGGNALRGRWQWHEGFWCRNLIIGQNETGTNCLTVEIQGNQVRARQDRGSGTETISTLR